MRRRITKDRYLSDAELRAFMEAVRSRRHVNQPRDYAFFALLANTGIRPSEALRLTRADVHLHAKPPWIKVLRTKKTKRIVYDELQLTPQLAAVLHHHQPDTVLLFSMTRRQAQRLFHYYARRSALGNGFHLYSLRHTAATRIYRATGDIKVVQALLGHEKPDTSAIYAHIPGEILKQLAEQLPPMV
jgi:integrase/recombinase XerD